MFSAIKVEGERLYKAARRGEVKRLTPRQVALYSIELLDQTPNTWKLRVHCSSGTYIRSLANDIGLHLGCGGTLYGLRRLSSGPFTIGQAASLEEESDLVPQVQPLESLLADFPRIDLSPEQAERVRHGNPVGRAPGDMVGEVRLFDQGALLAIAQADGQYLQPFLVF
jgi:tRNA pseudouridine55 synthase